MRVGYMLPKWLTWLGAGRERVWYKYMAKMCGTSLIQIRFSHQRVLRQNDNMAKDVGMVSRQLSRLPLQCGLYIHCGKIKGRLKVSCRLSWIHLLLLVMTNLFIFQSCQTYKCSLLVLFILSYLVSISEVGHFCQVIKRWRAPFCRGKKPLCK